MLRADAFVADARLTPDAKTVVMSGGHGLLRACDLATGTVRTPPQPLARSNLWALALSPDGRIAVAGGTGGEVLAWPIAGGDERVLVERGARVASLRFDAGGEHVLVERTSGPATIVGLDLASAPPAGGAARPGKAGAFAGGSTLVGPDDAARVAVAAADWTRWVALATPNQLVAGSGSGQVALPRSDEALGFIALSPRWRDAGGAHDGDTLWSASSSGGTLRRDRALRRRRRRRDVVARRPHRRGVRAGCPRSSCWMSPR